MDPILNPDGHTGWSTAGGVFLVLLNITAMQLWETVALAALGAVVSFGTSLALKALARWHRRRSR